MRCYWNLKTHIQHIHLFDHTFTRMCPMFKYIISVAWSCHFSLSFSVSLFLHNSNAYTKLFFTSIVGRDFEIETFARHRKAKQDDDRQGNKHNQMRITNRHSAHSSWKQPISIKLKAMKATELNEIVEMYKFIWLIRICFRKSHLIKAQRWIL